MLISKQKEFPYIHIFKLSSGEEIIAKVTEETAPTFVIKNPFQVIMGSKGVQLIPFMFLAGSDKAIFLHRRLILADMPAPPEVETQYESITTGIALPQKSSIITS